MNTLLKSIAAASFLLAGSTALTAPVMAQQAVKGIAVADQRVAIVQSSAFANARQQRPTTYKAQYDQATALKAQIDAQLKPLYEKANADSQAANPDNASLQQQVVQIRQIEQQGQQQINQILQPVALSEAYVLEQIQDKLDQAVKNAMTKKGISLVLDEGATISHVASYDMTQDITNELNALLPNAQLVPPEGWLPREQREAQARAAAAQQGQAAAPTPQPQGR